MKKDDDNYQETYDWIELEQANFIFPSFLRNTVQDIIHISDDTQEEITVENIYKADSSEDILSKCREKN
ncbi:hypothetical protein OL548_26290 [Lysinibacillus sp. MHQ-1]|nr:hypothetical protein OL548_26290 [Lysinibacillus sp. MHQ-1]